MDHGGVVMVRQSAWGAWRSGESTEDPSKIYRTPNEHSTDIYRKPIEHLSNIEHLLDINRMAKARRCADGVEEC